MRQAPTSAEELAGHGSILESSPCAFCGDTAADPVVVGRERRHGLPGQFQVVRCRQCDLLRTDPRPTADTISRYYPRDYEPYQRSPRRWRRSRALALIFDGAWTPVPASPPGRLLDLGTASGAFLREAQQQGWCVEGVERDLVAAREAAARTGARVQCADVGGVAFEPASFDVVCAWMVVEHLHDPIATLRHAHAWLKPGGWLALSVPDAGSWMFRTFQDAWFGLDLPRHLYHFTERTMTTVLDACGFADVRIGRPRTVGDLVESAIVKLDDRGWIARATSRRCLSPLPVRACMAGAGLLAGPLRISSCLIVTARKL